MRLSHSVGIATKVYSPRKNKVEELSIETPDYRLPDWLDQIIIINMVVFSTSFLIRLLKMRLSHSVGVAKKCMILLITTANQQCFCLITIESSFC